MKKSIPYVFALVVLTLALIPNVFAHPIKPIRSDVSLTFDWIAFEWTGTVSGDITGSVVVTPDVDNTWFPGKTEHFAETWMIDLGGDDFIEIYDLGVWSFVTFKFRANGRVTDASATYAYLIGAKVHLMGTTTPLDSDPLTATGTIRFN